MNLISSLFSFIKEAQWLQQIEALIIIVGLPIAIIKWFFYRPRLNIKFIPSETYHEVLEVGRGKDSLWLHLMCGNNGWAEAKNVSGYLVKVYNYDLETRRFTENQKFRNQIILKWAHEKDFKPQNIMHNEKRRLDVCFIYEDQDLLLFSTEFYPSGTEKTLTKGRYIVEIIVRGENIKSPARFYFPVSYNGWGKLRGFSYPAIFKFAYFKPYFFFWMISKFVFSKI